MRSRQAPKTASDRRAGSIAGVFGLKGELKIQPTSAGRSVFTPGRQLRFLHRGRSQPLTVSGAREHQGRLLVRFEDFDDATKASVLIGGELFAPRDAFFLEPNEYLDEDLVGCRLLDEGRGDLGAVSAVEHYPSQDVLVVGKNRIPLVRAFIQEIDLTVRQIKVKVPPGLID